MDTLTQPILIQTDPLPPLSATLTAIAKTCQRLQGTVMNKAKKLAARPTEWFIPPSTGRPIRDLVMALTAFVVCKTVQWVALEAKRRNGTEPEELSTYTDAVERLLDCIHDRSTASCELLDRRDQLGLHSLVLAFTQAFDVRGSQPYAGNLWDVTQNLFSQLEAVEGAEDPVSCLLGAKLHRTVRRRMTDVPLDLSDPEATLYAIRMSAESSLKEIQRVADLVKQAARDEEPPAGVSKRNLEDLLLSQMTDEIQSAKEICSRAHLTSTGPLRQVLADLARRRLCESRSGPGGGFRLPQKD